MSLMLVRNLDFAKLGVWEITENLEDLLMMSKLTVSEQDYFEQLKSPLRKKHWLGYRLILPHLLEPGIVSGITYDEYGKPCLEGCSGEISVAHSGRYACLIFSLEKHVGVDIEEVKPRVFGLAHKFLNPVEYEYRFHSHAVESICLIWCAKEALYKLYGKGGLSFREDLHIDQFVYSGNGTITGYIKSSDGNGERFTLYYESIDDYILVYVIGYNKHKGIIQANFEP